jgi:flagellar biogenesis protein FliO
MALPTRTQQLGLVLLLTVLLAYVLVRMGLR